MCYALSIHLVRALYTSIEGERYKLMAGEALQGVVVGEVGRLLCKVWDDDGSADALLSRAYGKTGAAIIGAPVRYSKRIFKNSFCSDPEPEDRPGDQPYGITPDTGQCSGVRYYVDVSYDSSFNGGTPTKRFRRLSGSFLGPVAGVEIINTGVLSQFAVYHNGTVSNSDAEATSNTQWTNGEVTAHTRTDGLPDTCGNQVNDPRPRYTGPVTYPTPTGPVTSPTTIIINNPVDNRKGRGLTIPFAWISPELNLNGEATINAEGNLEIDTNPGGGDSPGVDPNSPQPPPGPDSPPNPEGYREMRGVVVVTTKLGDATTTTEYGDGESPNLYLPRCASLLFAVNVIGSGNWTQPVDIETLRQWVPVLGDLPAYLAVAKPMNGYSCQLYPVYVDDERNEPIDDE